MKSKNEVKAYLNRQICICYTTIRDSENASGVVLSNTEKYRIAKLLDNAGVAQIDVGSPFTGAEEKKTVRRISRMGLNASVMAYNRAEKKDIDDSIECDVDAVSIGIPVSEIQMTRRMGKTPDWVRNKMFEAVSYAVEKDLYVSCIMEDATRASLPFLMNFALDAKEAGADRLVYNDSVGVEEPFSTFERVKILKQVTEMDIEIQSRNDFGLATANSLAGIKAGATFVGASLLGIGSRAGNAPLEEVALISEEKLKMSTGINLTALKSAAVALSRASGRKIWESKPVLGSGCFAQEAGLSADGSSSAIEILEPYDPAVVGGEREVVLGKHCSVESVIYLLKSLDLGIDPDQAEELTELVRQNASDQHRSLSTDDLYELYQDLMSGTVFRDEEDDEDFDSKRNPVDEE